MRSIDCQHPPSPSSLCSSPLPSPTRAPLPSFALPLRFASTSVRLCLFSLFFPRAVALFPLPPTFLPGSTRRVGPRPFSVMAQLFVYMGSKERFLMLRCHWRTRGWRTYCAEIASDIRDVQSHGNVLHGKISYGIGIFGTENRTMERNAG